MTNGLALHSLIKEMPGLPISFIISITVLCLYNYLRVTIARSPPSSKYPLEQQSTSLERYFSMSPEREIRTLKLQTANAVDEVVMLGGPRRPCYSIKRDWDKKWNVFWKLLFKRRRFVRNWEKLILKFSANIFFKAKCCWGRKNFKVGKENDMKGVKVARENQDIGR